jgi:ribosomal protein S10
MVKLSFNSVNLALLKSYVSFLSSLFKQFRVTFFIVFVPKKRHSFSLLKSPHVFKRHKEHFEILTYRAIFYIKPFKRLHFVLKYLIYNKPNSIFFRFFLER